MAELVGLVVALGCLVGVYWFFFRGATGSKPIAERGESLSSVALLEGLLAAMALAQVLAIGGPASGGMGAGILLGVVTGVAMRAAFVGTVVAWGFSLLGILASVPAITTLVAPDSGCFALDRGTRLVLTLAMVGIFLVTAMFGAAGRLLGGAGLAVRKNFASLGLGWYGLVEYTSFMATAAGMDATGGGTVIAFIGVVILAAVTPFAPQLIIWTVGVGLALVTLAGASVFGPNGPLAAECLAVDLSFPVLLGFLVAVIVTWLVASRVKR